MISNRLWTSSAHSWGPGSTEERGLAKHVSILPDFSVLRHPFSPLAGIFPGMDCANIPTSLRCSHVFPTGIILLKTCHHRGNKYDKCFDLTIEAKSCSLDSSECVIHVFAPLCEDCECRIFGPGVEEDALTYCCAHDARATGGGRVADNAGHACNLKGKIQHPKKMDSINRNQAEDTHEDLPGDSGIKKIKEIVNDSSSCFFCTAISSGGSSGARPMSVQEVDDDGNLWFLSASDSHKNQEIAMNPAVNLYFQGSAHSDFLHISGRAVILHDKNKILDLWKFILKTWFTEGINDPRITIIKVTPEEGYYWDTKHGNAVAGIKMLCGAMLGKTMDDSIEGKILPRN